MRSGKWDEMEVGTGWLLLSGCYMVILWSMVLWGCSGQKLDLIIVNISPLLRSEDRKSIFSKCGRKGLGHTQMSKYGRKGLGDTQI